MKRRESATAGKALSEPFTAESICIPDYYADPSNIDVNLLPDGITIDQLPLKVFSIERDGQPGTKIVRKSGTEKNIRNNLLSITNNELIGYPNVFYFDRQREKEGKIGFNSLLSKISTELNWRYRKSMESEEITPLWDAYYSSIINTVDKRVNKDLVGPAMKSVAKVTNIKIEDIEMALLTLEEPFAKSFLAKRNKLNQIPLSGMGSGISMIVTYFLLEHISQLSKGDAIFLIDEPEMHLHPQLQEQMALHFFHTSDQTILSTHSPSFVDLGRWKGITRFSQDYKLTPSEEILKTRLSNKTIREHLDEIPRWRQNETVFMDSDPELLFARRVLLVEGPADRYGFPRLARIMSKNFADTTIISCNGKSKIIYYVTLCHAFKIPAFIVFDLDNNGTEDKENNQVLKAIGSFDYHAFSSSFESLLGVGYDVEHKASKVLEKIDSIDNADSIPKEIRDAIKKIAKWSNGNKE